MMNVITGVTHTFRGGIGGWSDDPPFGASGPAATLTQSGFTKFDGFGSLEVLPSNGDPVYVYGAAPGDPAGFYALNGSQLDDYDGAQWPLAARLRAFMFVLCAEACEAEAILIQEWGTSFSQNSTTLDEATPKSVRIAPNKWTLVSVDATLASVELLRFTIGLKVSNHLETPFYVCFPVVQWVDGPAYNQFAHETYLRVPDYLRTSDGEAANPDRPLFRYLESMATTANDVLQMQKAFRYVPPDEANELLVGKSSDLTDPLICDLSYLRWLASVTGARLYAPSVSIATWESLEDLYPTWGNVESLNTWGGLETAAASEGTYDDYLRSQIADSIFGLKAGSAESIVLAVRNAQVDPSNPLAVTITGNYTGDPWKVLVTFADDTILPGIDMESLLNNLVAAGYELVVNP